MFTNILVGYDGSKGAKAALQRAAVISRLCGSKLTALWVREPLPRHSDLPGELEAEAEAAVNYYAERRREIDGVAARCQVDIRCEARRGHPAKTILSHAGESGCDLIVIGHSDHSELWGRLPGDTADRISDHANCSVLSVKEPRVPTNQPTTSSQPA